MRNQPVQGTSGALKDNWVAIAEVWGSIKYNRGDERFVAQQVAGQTLVTFTIRWSEIVSDLTTKDRVSFDGRNYDIRDVRELARREGIEIDAGVRSEAPLIS